MFLRSYVVNRKSVVFSVLFIIVLGIWFFGGSGSQSSVQSFLKLVNIKSESGNQGQASPIYFSGERYTNSQFNFSFEKPKDYSIREFSEGENYVILIQSREEKKSFQILITLLDAEDTKITKAIILSDIPGIEIKNEQEIFADDTAGLLFESDNSVFSGSSAEAWFMHKSNLYQMSGYKDSIFIIKAIINTWKWNKENFQ